MMFAAVESLTRDRRSHDGIVICAGGSVGFTAAFVVLTLLRRNSVSLPIQVWYLGWQEMDGYMRRLLESLGEARVVNLLEVAERHDESWPRLIGDNDSRRIALRHCGFDRPTFVPIDVQLSLHGQNHHPPGQPFATEIDEILAGLRTTWIGQPYDHRHSLPQDAQSFRQFVGECFLFSDHGYRGKVMLHADGRVSGWEKGGLHWTFQREAIVFASWERGEIRFGWDYGTGCSWYEYDRGLYLVPTSAFGLTAAEASEWHRLGVRNEAGIPNLLPVDSLVVDAHAGSGLFAMLCLMHGAENVIAYAHDVAAVRKRLSTYGDRAAVFEDWSEFTDAIRGRTVAILKHGGGHNITNLVTADRTI